MLAALAPVALLLQHASSNKSTPPIQGENSCTIVELKYCVLIVVELTSVERTEGDEAAEEWAEAWAVGESLALREGAGGQGVAEEGGHVES
jgi:hypothetical protein